MSRRAAPKANSPKVRSIAKTIAWSFFGVRRHRDHEQEGMRVSPIHVLVAGFVGIFVLVAGLMVLVNWVAA